MRTSRKALRSIVFTTIASLLALSLTACGSSNVPGNNVMRELKRRYGCEFTVSKASPSLNGYDYYVYPEYDKDLVFKASEQDSGKITDNFIRSVVGASLSDELEKEIKSYGLEGHAECKVLCNDDSAERNMYIDNREYLAKYESTAIFFYVALNESTIDNDASEKLISACKTLNAEYDNIQVAVNGAVITKGRYIDCAEDMDENADINMTFFDSYNAVTTFNFSVVDGRSNTDVVELQNDIMGIGVAK